MKRKRLVYNEPLGISHEDIIRTEDYFQLEVWRRDIYRQLKEMQKNEKKTNEYRKLFIFRRTLNMKAETCYLRMMTEFKERGEDIPIYRRDIRFMQKAKRILNTKTYERLLHMAEEEDVTAGGLDINDSFMDDFNDFDLNI